MTWGNPEEFSSLSWNSCLMELLETTVVPTWSRRYCWVRAWKYTHTHTQKHTCACTHTQNSNHSFYPLMHPPSGRDCGLMLEYLLGMQKVHVQHPAISSVSIRYWPWWSNDPIQGKKASSNIYVLNFSQHPMIFIMLQGLAGTLQCKKILTAIAQSMVASVHTAITQWQWLSKIPVDILDYPDLIKYQKLCRVEPG